MDYEDWKSKQTIRGYTHFDKRCSVSKCESYFKNPSLVAKHSFYPLIHYVMRINTVKHDGIKPVFSEPKERKIYYAAHKDSLIYSYYAYLLNNAYNARVEKDGLDDVAIAYRNNLGKNNIDFAKRAFDYIKKCRKCYVIIGDFTSFFDTLDHEYLKERLCDLLTVDRLSDDYYSIYKSVTQYAYVYRKDLLELHNKREILRDIKWFNDKKNLEVVCTSEQFKQLRANGKIKTRRYNRPLGVPQGTPISAVFANIYMLDFDKQLNNYVRKLNGLYMRYSDDFIVVVPHDVGDIKKALIKLQETTKLLHTVKLQNNKTKVFKYNDEYIEDCSEEFLEDIAVDYKKQKVVNFLGFSFDGRQVHLRAKTTAKYYTKLYKMTRLVVNSPVMQEKDGHIFNCKGRLKKELYRRLSEYGSFGKRKDGTNVGPKQGNFLTYVKRAQRVFENDPIYDAVKHHKEKIGKALRKGKQNTLGVRKAK